MHISWHGQTCVRLQTKNLDEDVTIIIDGYKPDTGEFPRSFTPQIALYTHGQTNAATLSQNPFVLDTPGECETKNVITYAVGNSDGNLIFKVNAENISLVHVGKLTKKIDEALIDKLGTVDILMLPVGGEKEYLDIEDAADVVTAIEPRIVIPIGYQCDTEPKALPLSNFIKVLGLKPELTDKKIIIKKKDLPAAETKLMILEKT